MDISSTLLENVAILLAEFFFSGDEGLIKQIQNYTTIVERCRHLYGSLGYNPIVSIEKDPNRSLYDDIVWDLGEAAQCAIKKNLAGFCDSIKSIEMYLVDEIEMLSAMCKMVNK